MQHWKMCETELAVYAKIWRAKLASDWIQQTQVESTAVWIQNVESTPVWIQKANK